MAKIQEREQATTAPGSVARSSREAGIAKLLEPAATAHEGARLNIFGRTRMGKSAFARSLLDEMFVRGICQTAIIHDPKYPTHQQYPGRAVQDQAEMRAALMESSVVVCRDRFPASATAETARALVQDMGEPTVLLIDETRRVLGRNQAFIDDQAKGGPGPKNFEWLLLEGGGLRASLVLLVQIPKRSPGEAMDSAQFSVVFGVGGRSLNYLVNTAEIVPIEARDVVKALQPGEFCIFSDDNDWDRTIYYSPLAG